MFDLRFLVLLMVFTELSALTEGEECILKNSGQKGRCISVYQCEEAKKILQEGQRPQDCGFNIFTILVCCPALRLTVRRSPGAVAYEMCTNYHFKKDVPFVSSSVPAKPKEFPHMAAIGYSDGTTIYWQCGGSIISEQFILTAAHCSKHRLYGAPKVVRLGDLDLADFRDEANPRDYSIQEIIINPSYKSPSVYHDIALIKLQKLISFDSDVRPACLHLTKSIPPNINLEVTGWGKTDYYGPTSSHLMKANLSLVSFEKCAERYGEHEMKYKNGIVDRTQVCAGSSGREDTCPGDSGGPLQYSPKCEWCDILPQFVIVGITSFGKGCGVDGSIGVYTRVSSYIEFIEQIVWNEQVKNMFS